MPDQDKVAQWKSFSPAQRDEALGKMTPDQKVKLKGLLEASTKAPAAAPAETPGFFKRAWQAINAPIGSHFKSYNDETQQLQKVSDFSATKEGRAEYEAHPIRTSAKAFAAEMEMRTADLLTPAFLATSLAPGANAFVKGAVPEIAPALNVVGKAAHVGTTAGFGAAGAKQVYSAVADPNLTPDERTEMALGGAAALTGTAAEGARAVQGKVTPGALRRTAQETFGAGEDFQKKVVTDFGAEAEKNRETNADVARKNAEARTKHKQDIEHTAGANKEKVKKFADATREHNRKVDDAVTARNNQQAQIAKEQAEAAATERVRQQTTDEHQKLSAEHVQSVDGLEKAVSAENTKAWNKLRGEMAGHTTDIAPVKAVVESAAAQADPTSSPLFKSILRTEDAEARPVTVNVGTGPTVIGPENPHYEEFYEAQYGEPPPLEGEGGQVDFSRLQRWYGYINDKLYGGGRLEGGTYNALKRVKTSLNDAMQNIAAQAGKTKDLAAARASHQQMMETFRDSPNEPATNASKSLKETSPKFVEEQARQKRLEMLGRYDPAIPQRAERIRSLQATLDALPSQEATAATNRPRSAPAGFETALNPEAGKPQPPKLNEGPRLPKLQEPEEAPEAPDLAGATRGKIEANLKKYGKLGVGLARLLVGGAIVSAGHADFGSMGERLLLGQGGLTILSKALRSESVLNWLSKPNPEAVRSFDTLPPEDAAKLKTALTQMAVEDAKTGKGGKIDPAVGRFLGPNNLQLITAAIAASQPKSAGEMKDRVNALQSAQ